MLSGQARRATGRALAGRSTPPYALRADRGGAAGHFQRQLRRGSRCRGLPPPPLLVQDLLLGLSRRAVPAVGCGCARGAGFGVGRTRNPLQAGFLGVRAT